MVAAVQRNEVLSAAKADDYAKALDTFNDPMSGAIKIIVEP